MKKSFSEQPLRAPWLVLALSVVATVALGYFARDVEIDSSLSGLLSGTAPETAYYRAASETFGAEETTLVAVFADDVFAPRALSSVQKLSSQISEITGVREVLSLTTATHFKIGAAGLQSVPLLGDLPKQPDEIESLRERVLAAPAYVGNLVSEDGRAAAILVFFDASVDEPGQRRIDARIRRLIDEHAGPEALAITGLPSVKAAIARMMERDILRFTPLSLLLVSAILVWAFGSIRTVVAAVIPVSSGVIWTIGLMALNGTAINMGTLVLGPMLLSIGIAYAIHIIAHYQEEIGLGIAVPQAVAAAVRRVRLPLGIAVLTTILGFSTFIPTSIPALHEFGIYSVVGLAAEALACITILPALLLLLHPLTKGSVRPREESRLGTLLTRLARSVVRHRREVLLLTGIVCVLSIDGIRRIQVEADYMRFFAPDSEVRRDNEAIGEHLAGANPISVIIDGLIPGAATDVRVLRVLQDLRAVALDSEQVDKTVSLLDYLAALRRALGVEEPDSVPEDQAEIEQLLTLLDPDELSSVLSRDRSQTNLIVRTRFSSSRDVGRFVEMLEQSASENLPVGFHVQATGMTVELAHSADTLARYQVLGLAQVIVTLLILLSVLLLSVRVGLLALIPNIIPVLVLFGLMGWLDIDLNVTTSMTAAIIIGLAVDDTVHFLTSFNRRLRQSGSQIEAAIRATQTVGRPVVFSSLSLCAGFLLVCTSAFSPIRDFGLLAGVTMLVALSTDLVVLPALVTSTNVVTLWDVLSVELGPGAHRKIRLFAGLRVFEARIVVLMATLSEAGKGTFMTTKGELGKDLYILLTGRAEVRLGSDGTVIRIIGPGDCIGEMSILSHHPRSADVVALDDVEYLVLDESCLQRLRSRHPRIAATVFLNLARTLSDRLDTTSAELAAVADGIPPARL